MRKQRFCTIMVLMIVTLCLLLLSSCGEDEMLTLSASVPSFSHYEADGKLYTEINVETVIVSNVEDLDVTNCKYKLYFQDEYGNIIKVIEMEASGTISSGESLTVNTTHTVEGRATLNRVVPVSFDTVEESSSAGGGIGLLGLIGIGVFLWLILKD